MNDSIHVKQVGSPDPELNNSPIAEEADEEREYIKQEVEGEPKCYFNNEGFDNGSYVCSSNLLLRCDYGVWVQSGSCDPDNP